MCLPASVVHVIRVRMLGRGDVHESTSASSSRCSPGDSAADCFAAASARFVDVARGDRCCRPPSPLQRAHMAGGLAAAADNADARRRWRPQPANTRARLTPRPPLRRKSPRVTSSIYSLDSNTARKWVPARARRPRASPLLSFAPRPSRAQSAGDGRRLLLQNNAAVFRFQLSSFACFLLTQPDWRKLTSHFLSPPRGQALTGWASICERRRCASAEGLLVLIAKTGAGLPPMSLRQYAFDPRGRNQGREALAQTV
jgi:hypothetical protein